MLSQAVTFFTAGYETTGNLISFTLYELALHPGIQERAREEILEQIEAHGDVTYESIQEMKYLNMVVAGKHLIYPPAKPKQTRICVCRNPSEVPLWSFPEQTLRRGLSLRRNRFGGRKRRVCDCSNMGYTP